MNNELKEKRELEIAEFQKGKITLKEKEEELAILQQQITGITNFLIQKKGRIEILNELIDSESQTLKE